MLKRVFSVMQKRDDLPEMTLPLAVLLMLLSCVFSCAGAKLLSAAVTESYAAGFFASLLFLPVSAVMYSLIILLWRRLASLLETPLAFVVMLRFGVDLFSAVVFTVSTLVTAYIFAVSMIARETKFKRLLSLTLASAACIALSIAGYIGLRYGSFSECMSQLMGTLAEYYSGKYIALGSAKTYDACRGEARELILMIPAYIGVVSILLSGFSDILVNAAFHVLDCENVFIDLTGQITMPKAFAAVYSVVFFLFIFTSPAYNPLLYAALKNLTYVMILPCAFVGLREIVARAEDEYFYMNRKRMLTFMLLALAVMLLGLKASVVITSVCGAFKVITRRRDKPEGDGSAQNI